MMNALTTTIFLLGSAGCAAADCAYGTTAFARLPSVKPSNFSYDALTGPLNWYGLNASANVLCDTGAHQSPIVIRSAETATVAGSALAWTVPDYPAGAAFENLGTNVQVIVNGTLRGPELAGTYQLQQFHFHTPSEHRVDDEFYPMEMHWVFQSDAKKIAVIGILVELAAPPQQPDPVLTSILAGVGQISNPGDAEQTGPLFFGELIRKVTAAPFWRYSGSLTTPPCAEAVDWFVGTQRLYLDVRNWLEVKKVVKYNARYTQDKLGQINLLQNAANELNNVKKT